MSMLLALLSAVIAVNGNREPQDPRVVSLRSNRGAYVAIEGTGNVEADRKAIDEQDKLELMSNADGTVSIMSNDGKFLAAHADGAVLADKESATGLAKFSLVANGHGKVSFKTANGRYISAGRNGALSAHALADVASARFTLNDEGTATVTLDDALDLLKTAKASLDNVETQLASMQGNLTNAEQGVSEAMKETTFTRKKAMALRRFARNNTIELDKFMKISSEVNASMGMMNFSVGKSEGQADDNANATNMLQKSVEAVATPEKIAKLELLGKQIWSVGDPSSEDYIGGLEKQEDTAEGDTAVFLSKLEPVIRNVLVKRLPTGVNELRRSLRKFQRRAWDDSHPEPEGRTALGADLGLGEPIELPE